MCTNTFGHLDWVSCKNPSFAQDDALQNAILEDSDHSSGFGAVCAHALKFVAKAIFKCIHIDRSRPLCKVFIRVVKPRFYAYYVLYIL